jgi:hypothetical protein
MGGSSSSSQVTGYKYSAKVVRAIGCPIENFIGINVDNRGWQYGTRTPLEIEISETQKETYGVNIALHKPNLFGKEEGGVSGNIQVFFGTNEQPPQLEYAAHMVANNRHPVAYQGSLSYMVFTGLPPQTRYTKGFLGGVPYTYRQSSFYFGNTGYLRQILLWPKRVNIRPSLREQWYIEKAEIWTKASPGSPEFEFDGLSWEMNDPKKVINNTTRVNITGDKNQIYNIKIKIEALVELRSVIGGVSVGKRTSHITKGGIYGANAIFNEYTLIISDPPQTYRLNTGESTYSLTSFTDEFDIQVKHGATVTTYATSVDNAMIGTYQYIRLKASQYTSPTDQNPIHAIREIFTEDLAMGLPEADMNDEMFMKAADQIYSEGLGISCAFQNKNCNEALKEICYHIEGGVRQNRQTGLYEPVLFRDDWYDLDTAMHFTPKEIRNFQVESTNIDEATNTLNVEYYDRDLIQSVSFPVYNNGAILNADRQNAEDVKFPYFMNARNAEMVAKWKLKQLTIPTWMGSFRTSHYNARSLNRYDVIKVTFPKRNIFNLPVRIMKINLGDGSNSNEVVLEWVEVVPYSTDMTSNIVIEEPIKTDHTPKPCDFKLYEMSYLDLVRAVGQREADAQINYSPDVGFLMVAAIRPQDISHKAVLYVEKLDEYIESTNVSYCPSIVLNEDIDQTDTMFSVKDGTDISSTRMQTIALLGAERIFLVDYDEETEILTVKRGIEHTIPTIHSKNDTIYIVHDFTNIDTDEYIDGEQVSAKVLTLTPSSMLSLDDAQEKTYEIDAIANKPYPPANVKINEQYFPIDITGDLVLTWSHRNRLQQTASEVLGWFDQSVTIEDGVEYVVELYDADNVLVLSTNVGNTNTATVDYSDVTTPRCKIKLYSIRDGYESSQAFEHEMILGFLPPHNLQATWNNTTQSVDLTWEFDE